MELFARAVRKYPQIERLLAQPRLIPDAQLELAVLYERRHRLAEAQALIADCLRAQAWTEVDQ